LDAHPSDERILQRRLSPHRSLSTRNFRILMAVFAIACLISSLPFLILGAWPIAGFMGLDVAIFYVAFRVNYRDARAYEDVLVTPIDLSLAKVSANGARREWHFSPSFVRLERQEIEEFGVTRLDIVSRGRRVEVAGCLGPEDKSAFADDLGQALNQARRGPRFS
jgi:uncharacterized membrane protein